MKKILNGWLRTWIFMSISIFVVLGIMVYVSWDRPGHKEKLAQLKEHKAYITIKYSGLHPENIVVPDIISERELQALILGQGDTPSDRIISGVKERLELIKNKEHEQARARLDADNHKLVYHYLRIWLAVSLGLLLFGLLAYWVCRGFRSV